MDTPWLTGAAVKNPQRIPAREVRRAGTLVGAVLLVSLLSGLLLTALPVQAHIGFDVSLPGLQMGINVPAPAPPPTCQRLYRSGCGGHPGKDKH